MSTLAEKPPRRTSGIYQIVNTVNGKRYIGSSKCIATRWGDHLRQMREGSHHAQPLRRAVKKYGVQVFSFSVLELCSVSELIVREQCHIDNKAPEYNVCKIAGSTEGIKHTPEQCEANSKRSKLIHGTPEKKLKMSVMTKTRFADEAYRTKFSASVKERLANTPKEILRAKYTPEVREKIRVASRGRAERFNIRGELVSAREIETKYGVSRVQFRARMQRGWGVERAATTPIEKKHSAAGADKYEYRGAMLTCAELARLSAWSKPAIFRRLVGGMTAEEAVNMSRARSEELRVSKSINGRKQK